MSNWYVARDGKKVGPYTPEQFSALLASGAVRPTDFAWRKGLERWVTVTEARQLVGTDIAPTPPGHLRPHPVLKSANYFVRHWRGELSLPVSYWVNGVLLSAVAFGAIGVLGAAKVLDMSAAPTAIATTMIVFLVLVLLANLWQVVGIWRAAAEHPSRGGSSFWAGAAKLWVVLSVAGGLGAIPTTYAPMIKGFADIAAGDKEFADYRLRVLRDASELEINGPIGFGLTKDVAKMLDAHPTVRMLHLNSQGGRIAEAYRLSDLITRRQLDTYTATRCESACIVPYTAGRRRLISKEGVIGLHQVSFPGLSEADMAEEQRELRDYLVEHGIASGYIDKALATPSAGMYRASHRELFEARVVTALARPDEVSMSGVRMSELDEVEAGVLKQPLFAALKQHEPEVYEAVLGDMKQGLLRGASLTEYRRKALPALEDVVERHLKTSSDEAMIKMTDVVLRQLRALRVMDPNGCYAYVHEQKATELDIHMRRFFRGARWYFNPEFLGLWELDLSRPALFVGNHTLFGVTDAPLMIEHLYTHYGVMLRALGDRGHFSIPGWGKFLERHGVVLGTPENCAALMKAGQSVLVFPGGGREVMRRKGEAYRLIWKQRAGFARLAIEHGYDIVPFGSLGPDESFEILLDANDVMQSRIWSWLSARTGIEKLTRGGDMLPPIARGIGPTLFPRPQRYYFGFGERIPTNHFEGRHLDPEAAWQVREDVARAVERQITRLIRYRDADRLSNWNPLRRWLAPVGATSSGFLSERGPASGRE